MPHMGRGNTRTHGCKRRLHPTSTHGGLNFCPQASGKLVTALFNGIPPSSRSSPADRLASRTGHTHPELPTNRPVAVDWSCFPHEEEESERRVAEPHHRAQFYRHGAEVVETPCTPS